MNRWIVQASPQQFLIDWYMDEYVRSNPNDTDWWLVERRYQDAVAPRDVIYVWKAKSEPPRQRAREYFAWLESIGRIGQVAGIFAVGRIETSPKPWPPPSLNDERFRKYEIGHPWDKLPPAVNWVACIYTDNRARNPLLQETIWERLGQSTQTDFGGFKKFRTRRLVKLEPWEADLIDSLLRNSK